jgi:hypothetical protein
MDRKSFWSSLTSLQNENMQVLLVGCSQCLFILSFVCARLAVLITSKKPSTGVESSTDLYVCSYLVILVAVIHLLL